MHFSVLLCIGLLQVAVVPGKTENSSELSENLTTVSTNTTNVLTRPTRPMRRASKDHPEDIPQKDYVGAYPKVCTNIPTVAEPGKCNYTYAVWFYNLTKRRCQELPIGFCINNQSIFDEPDDCARDCQEEKYKACSLPKNDTFCNKKDEGKRYWFNNKTELCEKFDYGGCEQNGNVFMSPRRCYEYCQDFVGDPCKLPIEEGSCMDNFTRYGYNYTTGVCERFNYSDCEGNRNNFETERECWDTCKKHSKSPCVESEVSHSWYGAWFSSVGWATRYFYNLEKSECESKRVFSLSTSGKNRFYTKQECESVCRRNYTSIRFTGWFRKGIYFRVPGNTELPNMRSNGAPTTPQSDDKNESEMSSFIRAPRPHS